MLSYQRRLAAWQEGKTALDIAKGRENNTDMVRRIEASTEGTDAHHTPTLRTPIYPPLPLAIYVTTPSSAPTLPLTYSWVVCTTRTPARACLRNKTRGNGVLPLPLPTG